MEEYRPDEHTISYHIGYFFHLQMEYNLVQGRAKKVPSILQCFADEYTLFPETDFSLEDEIHSIVSKVREAETIVKRGLSEIQSNVQERFPQIRLPVLDMYRFSDEGRCVVSFQLPCTEKQIFQCYNLKSRGPQPSDDDHRLNRLCVRIRETVAIDMEREMSLTPHHIQVTKFCIDWDSPTEDRGWLPRFFQPYKFDSVEEAIKKTKEYLQKYH